MNYIRGGFILDILLNNIDGFMVILYGLIVIGFSLMLCFKKKFIIPTIALNGFAMSILLSIPMSNHYKGVSDAHNLLLLVLIIGIFFGISYKKLNGKYTIMNMSKDKFVDELSDLISDNGSVKIDVMTLIEGYRLPRTSDLEFQLDLSSFDDTKTKILIKDMAKEVIDNHPVKYFSYGSLFMPVIGIAVIIFASYGLRL